MALRPFQVPDVHSGPCQERVGPRCCCRSKASSARLGWRSGRRRRTRPSAAAGAEHGKETNHCPPPGSCHRHIFPPTSGRPRHDDRSIPYHRWDPLVGTPREAIYSGSLGSALVVEAGLQDDEVVSVDEIDQPMLVVDAS